MLTLLFTSFALLACDAPTPKSDADPTPEDSGEVEPVYTGVEPSVKADLRMKRWRQISLDLQGALQLTPEQVCRETGLYDCTNLHVVSMGGISIDNGIYEPFDELGVTTGLAVERVALQACNNRLELDREAAEGGGEPVVFTNVALSGTAEGDPTEAHTAQVIELTQRLLGRNPEPEEVDALLTFRDGIITDGGGDAEWALMTCFVLATSTEALLY